MLLTNWLESREDWKRHPMQRLRKRSIARRRGSRWNENRLAIVELLEERSLLTLTMPVDINPTGNATTPVMIHGMVDELAQPGTEVGITAFAQSTTMAQVTYSLTEDAVGRFVIDPNTGVVTARGDSRLNFEVTSRHRIRVRAEEVGGGGAFTESVFFINVNDISETNNGVIFGNIWNDQNGNSTRENQPAMGMTPPYIEPEFDGQQVVLLDSSGNVVSKSFSYSEDRNLDGMLDRLTEQGYYVFGDLPAGNYTVRLAPALDLRLTFPLDMGSTADPRARTVSLSSNSSSVFAGDYGLTVDRSMATISGQVWDDLNGDGIHNANEPGLNGAQVLVLDKFGNFVTTTITADQDLDFSGSIDPITETGRYSIGSFPPDEYRILLAPLGTRILTFPAETTQFQHVVTIVSNSGNVVADFGTFFDFPPGSPVDTDPSLNQIQEGVADGSRVGIFAKSTDPDGGPVFYKLTDDAGGRFAIDRHSGMITVTRGRLISASDSPYLIKVVAASPSGAVSSTSSFSIDVLPTVAADSPVISVFGRPEGVIEGNFGARFVPVRVVLDKPSDQTITVQLGTSANPNLFASLPTDVALAVDTPTEHDYYAPTDPPPPGSTAPPRPLTLTFAPGQTEQVVRVQIAPDEIPEPTEVFFLKLLNPTNATLSISQNTDAVTILDEDAAPRILMRDVAMIEGDTPGQRELVFVAEIFGSLATESISTATGGTTLTDGTISTVVPSLTVNLFMNNRGLDTAEPGVDYTPLSGTITFTDTERLREIRIPILGDLLDEPNETLTLALSYPSRVGMQFTDAVGTIINDDSPNVELAINSATVRETDGPSQLVELKVVKVGKTSNTVSVDFQTDEVIPIEIRATTGADFVAQMGTLRFAPGEIEKSILIRVLGDRVFEGDEEFLVRLSNPTNAAINPDHRVGKITIRSNDKAIIPDEGDVVANDIADQLTAALANAGGDKSNPAVVQLLRDLSAQVVRDLNLTRALVFIIDPVDFIVSDPEGRRVGFTEATGTVNEVPGAYYSGNGAVELIVLPVTSDGEYNVQLTGLGGEFNYAATVVSGNQVTTTIYSDSLGDGSGSGTAINVDSNNAIPVGLGLALRGGHSDHDSSNAVVTGSVLSASTDLSEMLAQFNSSFGDDNFFNSSSSSSSQAAWQGFLASARSMRQQLLRDLFKSLNPEWGDLLDSTSDSPLNLSPEVMDLVWQRLGQSLTGVPLNVSRLGDLLDSLLNNSSADGANSDKPNGNSPNDDRRPRRPARPAQRPPNSPTPRSSSKPGNNSSSRIHPATGTPTASTGMFESLWRWLVSEPSRSPGETTAKTNS